MGLLALLSITITTALAFAAAGATLSPQFYQQSCPQAESTVRLSITTSLITDPTATAALLRLAFHDCQVGACDASIMLDSKGAITSELVSDRNFGVRQLGFIDRAKSAVDAACGRGKVSCADIIALAARDAVALSGGPQITIPLGRRDSTFASNRAADALLPPANIGVTQFLNLFASKGMTTDESVALLGGGHTFGVAHCVNFINRLYPKQDAMLGTIYATRLRVSCPVSDPKFIFNATSVPLDLTPLRFDNRYFEDVSNSVGLLTIDAELNLDQRTKPIVAKFAQNENEFFKSFSSAFVKLVSSSVLTGSSGQVRNDCHHVN